MKLILCLISFALSIDYSIGLISLQAYWTTLNGNEKLLGVVVGSYDAFTIIITPIIGLLIGRQYLRYKSIFMMGMTLNIIGNILYGSASYVNSWEFIFMGRIISGMGAASLPIIYIYIAETVKLGESQINTIGYVKYTAAFSRVIGPILGMVLSFMTYNNNHINQFTLAGWIPVIIGIVTLLSIIWSFPMDLNEKYIDLNEKSLCSAKCDDIESLSNLLHQKEKTTANLKEIIKIFWSIEGLGFIITFMYWYFMGNNFLIGTHFYHVVKNEHDLSNLYYSGLCCFIVAFLLFLFFKKKVSSINGLCFFAVISQLIMYLYLIQENVMYYIVVGLSTLMYAMIIPSITINNNILAKKNKSKLGTSFGFSITMLFMSQSFARFLGPSCFIILKKINQDNNCSFDNDEHYVTDGCTIDNYEMSNIIFITTLFVAMLICLCFIKKKKN